MAAFWCRRIVSFSCCLRRHGLHTSLGCGGIVSEGPGLKEFISERNRDISIQPDHEHEPVPYVMDGTIQGHGRRVYFETYGCQMNVNDTEIAWSILKDAGYTRTTVMTEADVILTMTCAIRDNAEKKVWTRLDHFKQLKKQRKFSCLPPLKVGVLGCMAERLKTQLLETDKMVDLVAGPDSYRDLPRMLSITSTGQSAVNVQLSLEETYADVTPVRMSETSPSAYVSIMRGCDNMCSFCIVPFTRGRERSRPMVSILEEIRKLSDEGVKEVTLLGQNVNSYCDDSSFNVSPSLETDGSLSKGFSTIYNTKKHGKRFSELLHRVAEIDPEMRIRFTSPHPKDFPNELLEVIKSCNNVCNHVHLPVQSGSNEILKRMRRGHSRESYLELVQNIRATIPGEIDSLGYEAGVALSSDFITGFCGESEDDHNDTLSLMSSVGYDMAFMFAYSMRKKTHAYHRMTDDVPLDIKQRRHREMVDLFYSTASKHKQDKYIGSHQLVLVEGTSKKSEQDLVGRADSNIKVVFPSQPLASVNCVDDHCVPVPGEFVKVKVTSASAITLKGTPILRTSLQQFYS